MNVENDEWRMTNGPAKGCRVLASRVWAPAGKASAGGNAEAQMRSGGTKINQSSMSSNEVQRFGRKIKIKK
jgi:hypothetical protein